MNVPPLEIPGGDHHFYQITQFLVNVFCGLLFKIVDSTHKCNTEGQEGRQAVIG